MSTNNIYFHDKLGQFVKMSLIICFLEPSEEFLGTQKRVQIRHGKRATGVRVIDVLLYDISRVCYFEYLAKKNNKTT